MTEIAVTKELHLGAGPAQCRDAPFHDRWRGDSIALADDGKGGRFVISDFRMACVGHHHS